MDEFYRKLSDAQLRAAYVTINRNIESDVMAEGMVKEKELILNVAKERAIDLNADTVSSKLETMKGYLEFNQNKG